MINTEVLILSQQEIHPDMIVMNNCDCNYRHYMSYQHTLAMSYQHTLVMSSSQCVSLGVGVDMLVDII